MKLTINIRQGDKIVSKTDINTDSQAAVFHHKIKSPLQIEFYDRETEQAAKMLSAKRNGSDLELTFEGSTQADVIFMDYYYEPEEQPANLVGMQEGDLYQYKLMLDDLNDRFFHSIDGIANEAVLSAEVAQSTSITALGWAGVGVGLAGVATVSTQQLVKQANSEKSLVSIENMSEEIISQEWLSSEDSNENTYSEELPSMEESNENTHSEELPSMEESSENTYSEELPSIEESNENTHSEELPSMEESNENTHSEELPSMEESNENTHSEELPSIEESNENTHSEELPSIEESNENTHSEELPSIEESNENTHSEEVPSTEDSSENTNSEEIVDLIEPTVAHGQLSGEVIVQAQVGSQYLIVNFIDETEIHRVIEIAKNSSGLWQFLDETPKDIALDNEEGILIFSPNSILDSSLLTAQSRGDDGSVSKVVDFIVGDNPITFVKLDLRLEADTGISNNDNYTNNPNIILAGVPKGGHYEYSLDGGYSWQSEVNVNGGEVVFRVPDNGKEYGQRHIIRARIVGLEGVYDADPLTMVYDHTIHNRLGLGSDDSIFIGVGEVGSSNTILNRNGAYIDDPQLLTNNRIGREFEEMIRIESTYIKPTNNASVDTWSQIYQLQSVDRAGNKQKTTFTQHTAYTIDGDVQTNSMNQLLSGTSDSLYINDLFYRNYDLLSSTTLRNTGDVGLQFQDGDDVLVFFNGTIENAYIDMGAGHDFLYVSSIVTTASQPVAISMGEGDDVVVLGASLALTATYFQKGMSINFAEGDDKLVILGQARTLLSTPVSLDNEGSGQLVGGDGFDTIVIMTASQTGFENNVGKWDGISEFEKIDIRGSFHVNDLSIDVLRQNHSKQLIDDNGIAHQGVFIIDGDSDDRVSFSTIGTQAVQKTQIIYEDKTYNSYHYDSNGEHYEAWIQQGIIVL